MIVAKTSRYTQLLTSFLALDLKIPYPLHPLTHEERSGQEKN